MENKFYDKLVDLLQEDDRFVAKQTDKNKKKELIKSKILNAAGSLDKKLIADLLAVAEFKEKFFFKVEEALVFDVNSFNQFVQDKKFLSNSYTGFKNKIGLNIDGKFLKERGEVSLVFPFKDCVLAGGMTKEEQKRDEVFFNEILAQDEIDGLLAPKVFSNFKKFTAKGESKVSDFERDENGTIKDNLIVKGNNLLALHSLKQEFQGKVKLIYIDPPYNTGNDGFNYNDNFNHSAWLTFMKNRLEVARKLLQEDGVIFVQCDDNEQAYLKVLMDEVFGRDNFVNSITVKAKVSAGASGGGEDKKIKKNTENLVFFCKNRSQFQYIPLYKKYLIDDYIAEHKQNNVGFNYTRILKHEGSKILFKELEGIKIYKHQNFKFDTVLNIQKEEKLSVGEVYKKYFNKIFMTTNAQTSILSKVNREINEKKRFVSYEYIPRSGRYKNQKTVKFVWNETLVVWFSDSALLEKSMVYKTEEIGTLWNDISWGRLDLEGGTKFKNGKKPESLLERILELSTQPSDIVLDYHLGSGTTCAVAHKMGRRYIGIEQMDYVETIACERMKKVIAGEQGGISKSVNWQGGGEFIYFELKKYNQEAVEKLDKAENTEKLLKIWQEMCEHYFLNYDVDIKKFNESQADFQKLTLIKQKKRLLGMLNKNQLYINLSEMNDSQFRISEEDKNLTKKFYKK